MDWKNKENKLLQQIQNQSKRAALLAKSNYGRQFGWFIEFEGETIGELTKYRFEEKVWDSYEITPLNKNHEALLFDPDKLFVNNFKFKNKVINEYIENAVIRDDEDLLSLKNRISVRSLFLKPKNKREKQLLTQFDKFKASIPEEEKEITSKVFESIELQNILGKKDVEIYLIIIRNDGKITYIHSKEEQDIYRREFSVKKKLIHKVQNLVEKYNIFDLKPSELNNLGFLNWFKVNYLNKGEYSITITNELFEKKLKFNFVHHSSSKNQNKLITFFEEIENIIRVGLPEDSIIK